jgi:hypothetical protein
VSFQANQFAGARADTQAEPAALQQKSVKFNWTGEPFGNQHRVPTLTVRDRGCSGVRVSMPERLCFFAGRPNLRLGRNDSGTEHAGDAPMTNSSFLTADRATHLKIVVVSLLASITVMVVGIAARPRVDLAETQNANVYKPLKAIVATSAGLQEVR